MKKFSLFPLIFKLIIRTTEIIFFFILIRKRDCGLQMDIVNEVIVNYAIRHNQIISDFSLMKLNK